MKIDIQKLKNGYHCFEFETSQEDIGLTEKHVSFKQIAIRSDVEKNAQHILVTSHVTAVVGCACDNCLVDFEKELQDSFTVFYTTDRDVCTDDDDDAVHVLESTTREINLADGVRNNLLLSLPMRLLCREDCKGLCAGCGANLNSENCTCDRTAYDPRWEGLKQAFKTDE